MKLEVEAKKRARGGGKKEKKGELVRGQATLQQAFAGRSVYDKSSDRYRFLSKKLALFIGCTNLPIRLVENDKLRGLIAALDPRYEVPGRTLANKHLDALMEELKGSIQQHLLAAQRISLCADVWSKKGLLRHTWGTQLTSLTERTTSAIM